MKCNYRGTVRSFAIASALGAVVALTACVDDFGKDVRQSDVVALNVVAPAGWTDGAVADEDGPESRCTSVDALSSDGDTPLYLHTIESDHEPPVVSSRGVLKSAVRYFSLSAICYPGSWPENETDVKWTPNMAHDIRFTVSGTTATSGEQLLWPHNGRVRFFAFALPDDDTADRPFTLSDKGKTGSPTITYTVPQTVTEQHDLLAACTDATNADVTLNFKHILTAVSVVASADMIPGKIKSVKLENIPSAGTFTPVPDGGAWSIDRTKDPKNYEVVREVTLAGTDEKPGYKPGTGEEVVGDIDRTEIVGETDDLTFLMVPQTLPAGAKITVVFIDELTGTERTLSADLGGKTWEPGKKVAYALSPSSIHITPCVEFNKAAPEGDNSGDILPYSGVWTDVELKAYAAVTTPDGGLSYVELPRPTLYYKFSDGSEQPASFYDSEGKDPQSRTIDAQTTYDDPAKITSHKGMLLLAPQSDFTTLQQTFGNNADDFVGTDNTLYNLFETYGESANSYMVGKPGYYKFPVVYGNSCKGSLSGSNSDAYTIEQNTTVPGMNYYVDYKGAEINASNYTPSVVADAKLAWQDSPDLIDDVKLLPAENGIYWVQFRVRKHTINQGNALLVVRDNTGEIVWSWHIWVSQHTDEWKARNTSNCCKPLKPIYGTIDAYTTSNYDYKDYDFHFTQSGKQYYLTQCNLGYCDPHDGDTERSFSLEFEVKIGDKSYIRRTTYKNGNTTCDLSGKSFTQAEFKGSLAGDNPYYQWGRKDPMVAGIYNSSTPVYSFTSGSTKDYSELSMENKPIFNVYKDDKVDYQFTRNKAGTSTTDYGQETGVDIMWTIKYPYTFVMSKYDSNLSSTVPNYRDHWHKFFTSGAYPAYAKNNNAKFFQMWNPKLKSPTNDLYQATNNTDQTKVVDGIMEDEDNPMAKSVYDPCPPGYCVPPAVAFTALAYYALYAHHSCYGSDPNSTSNGTVDGTSYTTSLYWDKSNRTWTVYYPGGGEIKFPATGVRNKSPRFNTFASIAEMSTASRAAFSDPSHLGNVSMPAFRMLMYVAGSTMGTNRDQVDVFYIDNRSTRETLHTQNKGESSLTPKDTGPIKSAIGSLRPSADSYGLNIRPALMTQ